MKKILLSAAAVALMSTASPVFAADAPAARIPIKAPPAHFDWTGWYGGVNYGYGVVQSDAVNAADVGSIGRAEDGPSAGVQLGYNWQYNPHWVAGLEADIGWLGIERDTGLFFSPGFPWGVKSTWYSTLRARLGYTTGPSLFYITGGAAFVDVRVNADNVAAAAFASKSEVVSGWTVGWGIETMLGGNWSAKTEYVYVDAGDQSVFNQLVAIRPTIFDNRFHVFRKALNYRFGGDVSGPLPAHNWAGFYGGWFAGLGVSQVQAANTTVGGSMDVPDANVTGGIQAGYNLQLDRVWVAGVEADIGWLGIDRAPVVFGWGTEVGVNADWYGTVRARLGRSTGPALLYATGGVAFVNVKNRLGFAGGNSASSDLAIGWTIGGGIEAALGNQWTAKSEYLMVDAGKQDVFNPALLAGTNARFDNVFHVFRIGVSRKFGS